MARKPRPRRTSQFYLPSAFDLFKPSKDLVLKNIHIFGPLFILNFIFWIHGWISTPAHGGSYWNRLTDANYSWPLPMAANAAVIGFTVFWFLLAIVIGVIVNIMQQDAQLEASEGREPVFSKLWATVKELGWRMLGLYVTMFLIILAGFIALIIPGFFMIRRYMLAPYVMLDKKCTIDEALKRSAELSLINTSAVWGLMGVLFLISLIGILPIIGSLASFILGFLYCVAPALRYRQLKKLA